MLEYRAAYDDGGQASIVDLKIVAIKINLILLKMCATLQLPRVVAVRMILERPRVRRVVA